MQPQNQMNQFNQPNQVPAQNNMPVQDKVPKQKNKYVPVIVFLVIVAVAGLGFGGYELWQNVQKDEEVKALQAENIKYEEQEEISMSVDTDDSVYTVNGLYTVGDVSTGRKYYLGVTDLDLSKDDREKDMYIINISQLGTKDGVKKYELRSVLDKAVSDRIAGLPDILAAGTTNERPKSSCKSYKVRVGDPVNMPDNIDWSVMAKWDELLPLTIYMGCIDEYNSELSLGTGLYSLDPRTNELIQLIKEAW